MFWCDPTVLPDNYHSGLLKCVKSSTNDSQTGDDSTCEALTLCSNSKVVITCLTSSVRDHTTDKSLSPVGCLPQRI